MRLRHRAGSSAGSVVAHFRRAPRVISVSPILAGGQTRGRPGRKARQCGRGIRPDRAPMAVAADSREVAGVAMRYLPACREACVRNAATAPWWVVPPVRTCSSPEVEKTKYGHRGQHGHQGASSSAQPFPSATEGRNPSEQGAGTNGRNHRIIHGGVRPQLFFCCNCGRPGIR